MVMGRTAVISRYLVCGFEAGNSPKIRHVVVVEIISTFLLAC